MSSRYVQPLRMLVQVGVLLVALQTGWQFYHFVTTVAAGGVAVRPGGIDAFLPISGLFGSALWIKGGILNPLHPAAVYWFLIAIGISLLMRRGFCSWICPVGTVSEWLWKLGFRLFKRNYQLPRFLDRGLRSIKYLLLAFFLGTALTWPVSALVGFLFSDYHLTTDIRLLNFFRYPGGVTVVVLVLLLLASLYVRNPFCRYLCPYGALTGLVAFVSPMAVHRDEGRCVSCGVCNQVCPSRLDVMHSRDVVHPECLGCWRCISYCRVHRSLSMRVLRRFSVSGIVYVVALLFVVFGLIGIAKQRGEWHNRVDGETYRMLLLDKSGSVVH